MFKKYPLISSRKLPTAEWKSSLLTKTRTHYLTQHQKLNRYQKTRHHLIHPTLKEVPRIQNQELLQGQRRQRHLPRNHDCRKHDNHGTIKERVRVLPRAINDEKAPNIIHLTDKEHSVSNPKRRTTIFVEKDDAIFQTQTINRADKTVKTNAGVTQTLLLLPPDKLHMRIAAQQIHQ